MARREEILEALQGIELLSSPAMGALQLVDDPDVDSARLGQAIEVDPALTANVLRFANSAYFGGRSEVNTVRDALVRLGMKTISRMLYMSVGSQLAPQEVQGYDMEPGALWDHMVSAAVATELLARELKIQAPAQAFTAALLHDIGKLVLGTNLHVDVVPILDLAEQMDIPFQEAETRLLGINHAEVGAELMRVWNLPESLSEAIGWHLNPNEYPGEDKLLVDLLHAANAITMLHGVGLGIDGFHYELCKDTAARLHLTEEVIEQVLCQLDDEVEKLTQVAEFR